MKYRIIATSRFEKDVKRCKKRNLPMEKLKKVIRLLEETGKLPPEYKPYKLSGQICGKLGMSYYARLAVDMETI